MNKSPVAFSIKKANKQKNTIRSSNCVILLDSLFVLQTSPKKQGLVRLQRLTGPLRSVCTFAHLCVFFSFFFSKLSSSNNNYDNNNSNNNNKKKTA